MTPVALEHACLRAWPGAMRAQRFGWTLQATQGRSWRANAVWPLNWTDEASLAQAIADAAAWCRAHDIAPCFKLADGATEPPQLAQALEAAGYAPRMETLVMTVSLPGRAQREPGSVKLLSAPDERIWSPLRESAPSPEDFAERRSIVERIAETRIFALMQSENRDAAIGLGVLTDDLLGLYLMRTAPWARRRGLAREIVRALIAWGAERGAACAYLQVEDKNQAAVALYTAESFTTAYRYRYWTLA